MRMDKLTSKFQLAIADAQSLAIGREHQFIEPIHMMSALLNQQGGSLRHLMAQPILIYIVYALNWRKRWIVYRK